MNVNDTIVGRTGLASTVLVVSLLMLDATSAASPVHTGTNISSPFSGSVNLVDSVAKSGCGGLAKLPIPPNFSLSTGRGGTLKGSTTAKVCTGFSENIAEVTGEFEPLINLTSHKGTNQIYVNGTYAMNGSLALTAGSCAITHNPVFAYCETSTDYDVIGYAYLFDVSTGQETTLGLVLNATGSVGNETSWNGASSGSKLSYASIGTTGPFSSRGAFALAALITPMVGSEKYELLLEVQATLYSESVDYNFGGHVSFSGASAGATLNMATKGQGFVLSAIGES